MADAFDHPQIILLAAHAHVRPGPEQAAMMIMVFGEIIAQDLAVEPVQGMHIGAPVAVGGHAGFALDSMIINQNRVRPFPEAQRPVIHRR